MALEGKYSESWLVAGKDVRAESTGIESDTVCGRHDWKKTIFGR